MGGLWALGFSQEGGVIYGVVFEKRALYCDLLFFFVLDFLGLILKPPFFVCPLVWFDKCL